MSTEFQVLEPSGNLDGVQANQFSSKIRELIDGGAKIVLVDFTEVTFMDSSGLGALVLALKAVHAAGAKLCLCSINEQIQLLFELTGTDRIFQIFPNRQVFENQILDA